MAERIVLSSISSALPFSTPRISFKSYSDISLMSKSAMKQRASSLLLSVLDDQPRLVPRF
jgi:hypothetical protein